MVSVLRALAFGAALLAAPVSAADVTPLLVDGFESASTCLWQAPSSALVQDVGIGVSLHNSSGRPDEHVASCFAGSAPEVVLRFTAPDKATYSFTAEAIVDVVLSARSTCWDESSELECADDFVSGAEIFIQALDQGQVIYLFLERADGSSGAIFLTIAVPS